uniref:Src kinase-associated phosphoprotein 1 n=1 Tax=Bubo bubo TaxID=30461 RepID=A0A8C0ESQ4_BUBBB
SYTIAIREKLYAEGYLADGLQNENLSAKAREQRDAILFGFQQVKARFDQHDAGFGQDSSDENQSWSLAPSMTSDASLPSDFQDDGNIFYSFAVLFFLEHSFFGSEWQKRWCVLNRRTFYYYANEKSKQPKGNFSIEHYSARLAFHLRKDSRKRCCFELICPGKRTYEFTAPSPAEAEDWVDQIQFLLKGESGSLAQASAPCLFGQILAEPSQPALAAPSINSWACAGCQDLAGVPASPLSKRDVLELCCLEQVLKKRWLVGAHRHLVSIPQRPRRDYTNYYQGMWDCSSEHPDELSFHRGDLIYILSKEYNVYGWWVGELNNVVGIVPKDYLVAAYDLEE